MKFIEMTGKRLTEVITSDEMNVEELHSAGVDDDAIVRINQQGDIEVRRLDQWDVIGGLLGDFEHRIKQSTGMTWA